MQLQAGAGSWPSACSDEAGYELDVVDYFDMVGLTNVFVAGDKTPGGTYGADVEPITTEIDVAARPRW